MEDKLPIGEVAIRDAIENDMSLVAEMTRELANFQNMPTGPKITAEELRRDGFASKWPLFRCKIAEVPTTGMAVGFAVYFNTYSTREGKAMLLQNLFVQESYRRRGVGRTLFRTIVREAAASGCRRLDFHVLEWNPARILYDEIGAQNLTERHGACYYMLSGEAFKSFASKTLEFETKTAVETNGISRARNDRTV